MALLALLARPAAAGVPEGAGVYQSDDQGRTWTHLESSPDVDEVFALAIDPAMPGRLVLATDHAIWLSDDEGNEWRRAAVPQPDLDTATFALAIDPTHAGRIWAGTEHGLLRSDDSGATWNPVGDLPPATALVAANDGGSLRLYAGAADGLRVSDDAGQSWDGEGPGLEGGVLSLAVDEDGVVIAGTTVGVFVREAGEGEFAAARGLPKGAARAVALTADGAVAAVIHTLYRRANGWQKIGTLPLAVNGDLPSVGAILPLTDGRLLLGTEHGLHSSENWKLVPQFENLTHLDVAALAADLARPERVYLGASSIPNSVALGRVGIVFSTAAVNEAPDERFAGAIVVLFLVGGVMAVRYLSRQPAKPS